MASIVQCIVNLGRHCWQPGRHQDFSPVAAETALIDERRALRPNYSGGIGFSRNGREIAGLRARPSMTHRLTKGSAMYDNLASARASISARARMRTLLALAALALLAAGCASFDGGNRRHDRNLHQADAHR
jgi:hypothetical protein